MKVPPFVDVIGNIIDKYPDKELADFCMCQ